MSTLPKTNIKNLDQFQEETVFANTGMCVVFFFQLPHFLPTLHSNKKKLLVALFMTIQMGKYYPK